MTSRSRPSSKQSSKLRKSNLPKDPPQPSASRFTRLSGVAARGLSIPRSLFPSRSSSPRRDRNQNKLSRTSARNSISSRASRSDRPPSSMRSSMASTPTSYMAPIAQNNVGELPVVGVSQRGYLASLVSLFSDGHVHDHYSSLLSTPVSTNTVVTEPSLGTYEYGLHSAAVYRFSKTRRLYVGRPSIVSPPPEALLEFEMETLPLMERDLQGICGHLGQQGIRITYELRMSGYASSTANTVSLAPTVWILYRSSSSAGTAVSVAELHQAVAEIFYLQQSLEIQEGGGRIELSSDQGHVNVGKEDPIHLSDGGKLSVHIEDCQEKSSVCGARVCTTIEEGPRQIQSLCRIGGLLKINGKYILAISTAHAMLDNCGIFRDSFEPPESQLSWKGKAVDRDSIFFEANRVSKWHDITRDAAVDFLGISMNSRGEMAINRAKPENATDFALLRIKEMPGDVMNKYIPPRSEEAVTITSTASESAASMDEGPIYILCGGSDIVDAQLVWGSACFIVRGRNFRVRRIQTARPLSAGVSGSWVVRGEVLYGVIIAVYENEPFALMMTAERLFESILGSAFSIRSVELWDGETPNISQLRHRKDVADTPKETVLLNPKKRSKRKSEARDEPAVASSSKNTDGSDTQYRSRIKSEGTQTVDSQGVDSQGPTGPGLADGGAQMENLSPPTRKQELEGDERVVTYSSGRSTAKTKRLQKPHPQAVSKAPAIVPAEKRSSDQGHLSESGSENYTTPPQSVLPIVVDRRYSVTTEVTAGAPHHQSESASLRRGGEHGAKTTKPISHKRRNSLRMAFDKTFRRLSGSKDNNPGPEHKVKHDSGIPPTGPDGRTPVFNKRRSVAAESTRTAGAGDNSESTHDITHEELLADDKPSFFRRLSAAMEQSSGSKRDSNHCIPPGGLDEDLSFFKRLSINKGKYQEAEASNKDKNFGIPPDGL